VTPDLTPEQRSEVVYAFLKVGVPPTAVARALDMDTEHVAGARSQMLVERYGTDEKAEAMDWLIWEAYEIALNELHNGTPASKARFVQLVLARSVGLAGKSAPETSEKIRTALEEMASAERRPAVSLAPSIYDPSE
jgi:hypothetical protein